MLLLASFLSKPFQKSLYFSSISCIIYMKNGDQSHTFHIFGFINFSKFSLHIQLQHSTILDIYHVHGSLKFKMIPNTKKNQQKLEKRIFVNNVYYLDHFDVTIALTVRNAYYFSIITAFLLIIALGRGILKFSFNFCGDSYFIQG